jgi:hypothetical protein
MYLKEDISRLKGDIKTALSQWGESKIDALSNAHPQLRPMSVYLRRGLSNYLDRIDDKVDSAVDMLLLFVADKNGNIDTDMLINDAVEMFKLSDVHQTNIGAFDVTYGAGEILLTMPHNPLLDIFFGNLGQIRLTAEDLLEMKNFLK